jgi:hypothetical protein
MLRLKKLDLLLPKYLVSGAESIRRSTIWQNGGRREFRGLTLGTASTLTA